MPSVPVVASIPSPEHGVVHLGPLPLHLYGLIIAAGVLVAAWLAERRWVRRGHDGDAFGSMVIWIVVGGVIPPQDYDELYEAGAVAVFPPGTVIHEAASDLLDRLAEQLGYSLG